MILVGQIGNKIHVRNAKRWRPKEEEFEAFGGVKIVGDVAERTLIFKNRKRATAAFQAMLDEKVPCGKALVHRPHAEWFPGNYCGDPLGPEAAANESPWAIEAQARKRMRKRKGPRGSPRKGPSAR